MPCRCATSCATAPGALAGPHSIPARRAPTPRRSEPQRSSDMTGVGRLPALYSTSRQAGCGADQPVSTRTDHEQFDNTPNDTTCNTSSPIIDVIAQRPVPPCVATTKVSPGATSTNARSIASTARAATSERNSPPPGRTSPPRLHWSSSSPNCACSSSRSKPSHAPAWFSRNPLSCTTGKPVTADRAAAVCAARCRSDATIATGDNAASSDAARSACASPTSSSATSI